MAIDANPDFGEKTGAGFLKQSEQKTAFDLEDENTFPGHYKITKLEILSPIRGIDKPISLQEEDSSWTEINFYENLNSPILSGDLTIMDGVGFIESVPIIGEEFLVVSMQTAGGKLAPIGTPGQQSGDVPLDQLPTLIKSTFRIYKVDPPQGLNDNFRLQKFHFIADTQITNMMVKVQKTYPSDEIASNSQPTDATEDKTYTIADMVRDIYIDAFLGKKTPIRHKKTQKNLLVEPTKGVYSACIPNWTPFKAINFLAGRAISANKYSNGANFVFYETLKGYRFISIETLMMGGFRGYTEINVENALTKCAHYNTHPTEVAAKEKKTAYIPVFSDGTLDGNSFVPVTGDGSVGKSYVVTYSYTTDNVQDMSATQKRFSVSNYTLVHSFDTVTNLGMGMYANRVLTHDLVRMKWKKQDFHYVNPEDVVTMIDEETGAQVEQYNTDKAADDQDTVVDTFMRSDPGKICSNAADMLGRPESHISLYPTNSGISTKFATGIRSTTFYDSEGEMQVGADFQAKNVHGKKPEENPVEMEKRVEEWLGQRVSQKRQIDTVKVQFSTSGDSAREVGDLIWFNFPTENPKAQQTGIMTPHKYFSGKFLITAMRHRITNDEYTIHIEAIKDGYRSQISPTFKPNNPIVQTADGTGVAST